MFQLNDRFVYHKGTCTLHRASKDPGMTCTCPGAEIDAAILDVLHDQLKRELKCNIEVVHAAGNGFSLVFRSATTRVKGAVPPTFYISNAPVNIRRQRLDQEPIEDLTPLVNKTGAELISWILMTIYDEPFSYEPNTNGVGWKPSRRISRIPA